MRKGWLKLHHGTLNNPALALIAKRLNIKRTAVQAAWIYALEQASAAEERGTYRPDEEDLEVMALVLDEDMALLRNILLEFINRGLVVNSVIKDWHFDQMVTSKGAKRQAAYIKRKKAASDGDSDADPVTSDGENVTNDAHPEGDDGEGEGEEEGRSTSYSPSTPLPPSRAAMAARAMQGRGA